MRPAAVFWIVLLAAPSAWTADSWITIDTPMKPPAWAFLERQLLQANSKAAEKFGAKYLDSRGYLLHTPRWGTLDGPDDAIETFYNWTLLHALGGSDTVLTLFKKALEGHYKQYGELRTKLTKLAENGAYYKEFITQSDWFHTGEGMRGLMFLGLSDPNNATFRQRMQRFAAMYMGEDPEAPNYDPQNKVIRSLWTGSKGPMLHQATVYDWVGDPVPGSFHLLHNKAGRSKLLDLKTYYPKMLAHCKDYLDSVGDHPLNLAATHLALNAYMTTHDSKYRDWIVEYVTAWKQRTEQCGGNIPTNVGLDGKPGGEYNGQWWKGTYGWNFTIYDGEIEEIAHRNTFAAGSWPGFANALLVTGDQSFIATLRRQMDNIYAQKRIENGRTLLPQMYGDPRGYHQNGSPSWYHYTANLFTDRLLEIYFWSMDRKDLERLPQNGFLGYLEGREPDFPEKALAADLEAVRRTLRQMDADTTTADTRLADYLQALNPVHTQALTMLTLGAYLAGNIWSLHARFRYFDPERRRAGLPEDVAALVEKLSAGAATLTLVNLDATEARTVVVQAGGYGEHRFDSVSWNGKSRQMEGPTLWVRLEPGAGSRLEFQMTRYVHQPSLAYPWDRGWYPGPAR
ncbi:MAG: hypothetical protein NZV14_02080 [Bryobacteraceae bacterium]|nr:hypothetical protein [Bryobacteraceae bacterium]MDW8376918.1 hypothetical protein [Bryobacterales bacterium]